VNAYLVGPDLGDAIATLCVIRYLGPGHIRLFETPGTKGFSEARYNAIVPLIKIQPYTASVARFDPAEDMKITHDFTGFRNNWGSAPSLVGKQARHVGLDPASIDMRPWLEVGDVERHGKIVLCRSARNKGHLHWWRIWQAKGKDCVVLGLREDYEQFCVDNAPWAPGMPPSKHRPMLPFLPTDDLLQAARVIKGARLGVFNQTSLLWLAYGTGFSPMIIEQTTDDSFLPGLGRRFVRQPRENLTAKEVAAL